MCFYFLGSTVKNKRHELIKKRKVSFLKDKLWWSELPTSAFDHYVIYQRDS